MPGTETTSRAPPRSAWTPRPPSSTSAPTRRPPSWRRRRSLRAAARPDPHRTFHFFFGSTSQDGPGRTLRRGAQHGCVSCAIDRALPLQHSQWSLSRRALVATGCHQFSDAPLRWIWVGISIVHVRRRAQQSTPAPAGGSRCQLSVHCGHCSGHNACSESVLPRAQPCTTCPYNS